MQSLWHDKMSWSSDLLLCLTHNSSTRQKEMDRIRWKNSNAYQQEPIIYIKKTTLGQDTNYCKVLQCAYLDLLPVGCTTVYMSACVWVVTAFFPTDRPTDLAKSAAIFNDAIWFGKLVFFHYHCSHVQHTIFHFHNDLFI